MPIEFQKRIETLEQSQLERIVRYYLMRELKTDITLTAPVVVGTDYIDVSVGHGFTAVPGEVFSIFEGNKFYQLNVTSVSTNRIYTNIPFCCEFTTNAKVIRGNINLNLDFSSANASAKFSLFSSIPIDITQVNVSMAHGSAADDGMFGGITSLSKGVLFRHIDGSLENYGNYKSNMDFRLFGYDVVYTSKGPGGSESTFASLNLKNLYGKEIRLFDGDEFLLLLRDKLDTLTSFRVCILGSYTGGE